MDRAKRFNQAVTRPWEGVRDVLALHYRFNTRLDTPFWRSATRDTPLGNLTDYVDTYQRLAPSLLADSLNMFGHDGCLALLLGMRVAWDPCEVR